MTRTIALGADHGGFSLKEDLIPWLKSMGHQVSDLGAHTYEPDDDYPDFVEAVTGSVVSGGSDRGIIICGSGVGATVAANKVPGVRACMCHDTYSAHQGVEHDDLNVLCLGGRVICLEMAKELIAAFLDAEFSNEDRHRRRMAKVADIERRASGNRPG